jgi:hypothetical protein
MLPPPKAATTRRTNLGLLPFSYCGQPIKKRTGRVNHPQKHNVDRGAESAPGGEDDLHEVARRLAGVSLEWAV